MIRIGKFRLIPNDEQFWNHALWVCPSLRHFVKKHPLGLDVFQAIDGSYFTLDSIPF